MILKIYYKEENCKDSLSNQLTNMVRHSKRNLAMCYLLYVNTTWQACVESDRCGNVMGHLTYGRTTKNIYVN